MFISMASRFVTPSASNACPITSSRGRDLLPPLVLLCLNSITQVVQVQNGLEGNTMSNRGAYSTKERMPSDRELPPSLPAWKAVPDWLSRMISCDVLPSRQIKDWRLTPRTSSFSLVCTGLLIVLPSRQVRTPET